MSGRPDITTMKNQRLRAMRRKGRGRPGPTSLAYDFEGLWNVAPAANAALTKTFKYHQLGIDPARPCRLTSLRLNTCLTSGAAANFQVTIYGPTGSSCNVSAPMTIGNTTRTLTLTAPRVQDFFVPVDQPAFSITVFSAQNAIGESSSCHILFTGQASIQYARRDQVVSLKL